ncbi:hypothetical protein OV079_13000 [Nannocystis pusilla]|uniref:Uncharacterized protein n=1 Tax=Nannocystis pusilla TaxID=889268 RepID=A0A9X3IWZ9_9BACT|nr:hypothetical protein [Nannocystis pusilla]MCY1006460.1 hypothetical protein [Nannocystis pusilla]
MLPLNWGLRALETLEEVLQVVREKTNVLFGVLKVIPRDLTAIAKSPRTLDPCADRHQRAKTPSIIGSQVGFGNVGHADVVHDVAKAEDPDAVR